MHVCNITAVCDLHKNRPKVKINRPKFVKYHFNLHHAQMGGIPDRNLHNKITIDATMSENSSD